MKSNISVKDKVISCSNDKNLMDSLSSSSNVAPKGCHNGGCGICKIKIHSGEYDTLKMSRKHISEEEEKNGIVLACRVLPKSDMNIEFIAKPKPITYTFGS